MSTSTLLSTRNLFINSETVPGNTDGRNIRLNVPQGSINCNPNQHLRLTLSSFELPVAWYRINSNNNIFYFVALSNAGAMSKARIVIPEGNYQSFTDATHGLGPAIKKALDDALTAKYSPGNAITPTSVEWDLVKNTFKITIDKTVFPDENLVQEIKFVAFTLPAYTKVAGNIVDDILESDYTGAFQDSHQILGGCNEKRNEVPGADTSAQFANLTSLFNDQGSGYYAARLQSMEAIYLHTNLQTTDFMSNAYGFPQLVSTRILAAIPAGNTSIVYNMTSAASDAGTGYQKPYETIEYMDNGNNLFSSMLRTKSVPVLELSIRDSYGRLLPLVSQGQRTCNAMSFTCTIRIDVFEGAGPR